MGNADWIAVDWGTSSLRAWGMSAEGAVLWAESAGKGMGGLAPDAFEPAFMDLVGAHLTDDGPIDAVACGMVGARQGWVEAPYRPVPCAPLDPVLTAAPTRDPRLRFRIVSGLSQSDPADVMRGEETQIAGFQSLNPRFDGVICLPGTHSKWVHVSAGEVVSFQTFMTGELFSALATQTVLRHSVQTDGWDGAAFAEAVDDAVSRPEKLAARLFSLRAEGLLSGLPAEAARARLSGLLIGAELAAARPYWLGQNVAIVGASTIARRYAEALAPLGVPATVADGDQMVLKGLVAAQSHAKETHA
ncbi:2-dehydro-3-deoxygalactonokinase [Tropicimonas isoalkanivorans]|uniref:2-dehydro-3-deoxygalactonokinase n=1 Tax=Tropicimonas isoalkanivorans TaxID=441112 RepID=A0A1I1NED3_9RHOB|nr:2-dehydro-3-deoxygalactonokinase [Tropicimonas isoalkanivorans]SFC95907.1 2-dehydro-3-deoxygalactonokinase [Tropicimonas isoalkanivorans]